MIFYVDGACHGNPGPGGFGVVIVSPEGEVIDTYSKGCEYTTNNAEELKACLWAACHAIQCGEPAIIYSDSAYAVHSFTDWMFNWSCNDWKNSKGETIKNLELIQAMFELLQKYNIQIFKVAGHNGVFYNEMADKLATSAKPESWIEKLDIPIKKGRPYGL